MLFSGSYPPVPLSTGKGGTHHFGFCSYEGAVRRAKLANEKRGNSCRSFPDVFVQTASGGLGLRPGRCDTALTE